MAWCTSPLAISVRFALNGNTNTLGQTICKGEDAPVRVVLS